MSDDIMVTMSADDIEQMLMIADDGQVECNYCSRAGYVFRVPYGAKEGWLTRAFEHFAEYHPSKIGLPVT